MTGIYQRVEKVDFTSWLKQEVKKVTKSKNKNANIVFTMLSALTDDDYWQQILTKAGDKKFPKGFTYKEEQLVFKKGNKVFNIYVTQADPNTLETVKEFFRTHGNMISPNEIATLEQIKKEEAIPVSYDWKDLSKSNKLQLIISYGLRLSRQYNLDREKERRLISTLLVGFTFRYFTVNNLVVSDLEIKEINNLIYDPTTHLFSFYVDSNSACRSKAKAARGGGKKSKKNDPYSQWCDHINKMEAKVNEAKRYNQIIVNITTPKLNSIKKPKFIIL